MERSCKQRFVKRGSGRNTHDECHLEESKASLIKLDFLGRDQKPVAWGLKEGAKGQQMKKGPNAKQHFKNQMFGFGGKKKGSKLELQ